MGFTVPCPLYSVYFELKFEQPGDQDTPYPHTLTTQLLLAVPSTFKPIYSVRHPPFKYAGKFAEERAHVPGDRDGGRVRYKLQSEVQYSCYTCSALLVVNQGAYQKCECRFQIQRRYAQTQALQRARARALLYHNARAAAPTKKYSVSSKWLVCRFRRPLLGCHW